MTPFSIVVVSNQSQPQYLDLALSSGAKDFLVKPVDFAVLENTLKKQLDARGNEYSILRGNTFSDGIDITSGDGIAGQNIKTAAQLPEEQGG